MTDERVKALEPAEVEPECPDSEDGKHTDGGFDPDWNEFICGACHDEYVPAEQRAEGGA